MSILCIAVTTTLVSTLVSFGAGLSLYWQSVESLKELVAHDASSQLQRVAEHVASKFEGTKGRTNQMVDLVAMRPRSEKFWRVPHADMLRIFLDNSADLVFHGVGNDHGFYEDIGKFKVDGEDVLSRIHDIDRSDPLRPIAQQDVVDRSGRHLRKLLTFQRNAADEYPLQWNSPYFGFGSLG